MNALQIEGVVAPKKPIVGTLPRCCAQAGYGLTTGASAAPHSNATNARRRKPLIGAVRSIGARLTGFRSLARHPPCGWPSGADLPAWEGYSNISPAVTGSPSRDHGLSLVSGC